MTIAGVLSVKKNKQGVGNTACGGVLKYIRLIHSESTTNIVETKEFWVNMPNLLSHLKRVAEQKPQATYYNVDMIKYQVWKDL